MTAAAIALAVRPPSLNAPGQTPGPGHNRTPGRDFTCRECGDASEARADHGDFCSATCRSRWNNRRLQRGAVAYDLLMTLRYQRGLAKTLHVWRLLCRLAADFRAEDHEQRDGRRSWREARGVIQQRPYLQNMVFKPRKGKSK